MGVLAKIGFWNILDGNVESALIFFTVYEIEPAFNNLARNQILGSNSCRG